MRLMQLLRLVRYCKRGEGVGTIPGFLPRNHARRKRWVHQLADHDRELGIPRTAARPFSGATPTTTRSPPCPKPARPGGRTGPADADASPSKWCAGGGAAEPDRGRGHPFGPLRSFGWSEPVRTGCDRSRHAPGIPLWTPTTPRTPQATRDTRPDTIRTVNALIYWGERSTGQPSDDRAAKEALRRFTDDLRDGEARFPPRSWSAAEMAGRCATGPPSPRTLPEGRLIQARRDPKSRRR